MSGGKEPPRLEGYTQRDEETAPEVFEVSGSVKWFDPSRGYGFNVPGRCNEGAKTCPA
jgi:cold shock protein